LRLNLLHFPHVPERRPGERRGNGLDERGEDDDGDAVIAGDPVERAEAPQQRYRDEPEPAEVERPIEVMAGSGEYLALFRTRVDRECRASVDDRRIQPGDRNAFAAGEDAGQ